MQQTKTSKSAIFALIFSFLFFPLGILLAIVAFIKIGNSQGQLTGKGLAIAARPFPWLGCP